MINHFDASKDYSSLATAILSFNTETTLSLATAFTSHDSPVKSMGSEMGPPEKK